MITLIDEQNIRSSPYGTVKASLWSLRIKKKLSAALGSA
eukprot:CAMPEP_0204856642 /NCGR_PEP_ID=MMETSP1347-20130617/18884_1 /ASSEMBLY_ACC=CAM_ASM_000690 /TAXON_ID=215587 /ORGANISM="Aplanochytrium stocchinoi, Strain GSBS06" /LENGTH=38 /DNA_ID= /DNA_START= /DNA_END= /DNA_ORIENTATION=